MASSLYLVSTWHTMCHCESIRLLNPGLQHCSQILHQLSHKGSPWIRQWLLNSSCRGRNNRSLQSDVGSGQILDLNAPSLFFTIKSLQGSHEIVCLMLPAQGRRRAGPLKVNFLFLERNSALSLVISWASQKNLPCLSI